MPSLAHQKINILGVDVSAIDMPTALAVIEGWIAERRCNYACFRDVHGLMLCQGDEGLRRIHNDAGMVAPDGVPLVWVSRLLGHRNVRRVCGPDIMLALCERSLGRGDKHFFYGGGEGVAERLAAALSRRYPGLQVAGCHTPPFRAPTEAEDAAAVDMINGSGADIVWIGLGSPKQERWMAGHLGRISAPVMLGVGAAFNFHSGAVGRAPRWMQNRGLEWLFRLLSEPRRLWRRYLILAPKFVVLVGLQLLGFRPPRRDP